MEFLDHPLAFGGGVVADRADDDDRAVRPSGPLDRLVQEVVPFLGERRVVVLRLFLRFRLPDRCLEFCGVGAKVAFNPAGRPLHHAVPLHVAVGIGDDGPCQCPRHEPEVPAVAHIVKRHRRRLSGDRSGGLRIAVRRKVELTAQPGGVGRHDVEGRGLGQCRLDHLHRVLVLLDRQVVQGRGKRREFQTFAPLHRARQAFGIFADVAADIVAEERHAAQKLFLARQMQARQRRLAAPLEMTVVRRILGRHYSTSRIEAGMLGGTTESVPTAERSRPGPVLGEQPQIRGADEPTLAYESRMAGRQPGKAGNNPLAKDPSVEDRQLFTRHRLRRHAATDALHVSGQCDKTVHLEGECFVGWRFAAKQQHFGVPPCSDRGFRVLGRIL